jgi:hypothetical protein
MTNHMVIFRSEEFKRQTMTCASDDARVEFCLPREDQPSRQRSPELQRCIFNSPLFAPACSMRKVFVCAMPVNAIAADHRGMPVAG